MEPIKRIQKVLGHLVGQTEILGNNKLKIFPGKPGLLEEILKEIDKQTPKFIAQYGARFNRSVYVESDQLVYEITFTPFRNVPEEKIQKAIKEYMNHWTPLIANYRQIRKNKQ